MMKRAENGAARLMEQNVRCCDDFMYLYTKAKQVAVTDSYITYANNRDLLLSSLASNVTADGGFYSTTTGQYNDTVYALVLCISDPSAEDCASCVDSAIQELIVACPSQKEAITWGGDPVPCIVRYANRPILGTMELSPTDSGYNTGYLKSNLTDFDHIWTSLMTETVARASMNSSRLKMAAGVAKLTSSEKIYVLMQCTPDISQSDCSDCLQNTVTEFRRCCFGRQGGYVQKPNCFLRWDLFPFYQVFSESPGPPPDFITSSPSPTNTTSTINEGKGNNSPRSLVAIIVPPIIFFAFVVLACTFFYFRKPKQDVKHLEGKSITECKQLRFSTIRLATNNFSDDNKLGQGGFGAVYKGTLPDGQAIAVKRLSRNSGQGEVEFKNEVLLLSKLHHRNLVRLLDPNRRSLINWDRRYNIIFGIARGILYLHQDSQLRIIHRDLKASNILLDEKMTAKISDFGLARLIEMDQTRDATSRIVGTLGYMAPEYALRGHFSVQSDVFSFGVLVLEIITGRKNSLSNEGEVEEYLLTSAWERWNDGTTLDLIDPTLLSVDSTELLIRCFHIGLLCVQENIADRPTMDSVVLMLGTSSAILSVPSMPAYFMHSVMGQQPITSTSYSEKQT
uniref:Cysteine-rich receptor-like protein kinase n=1 Tax=Salix viminalis TaxID=40686 RepID=A0A6N2NF75_SALVM